MRFARLIVGICALLALAAGSISASTALAQTPDSAAPLATDLVVYLPLAFGSAATTQPPAPPPPAVLPAEVVGTWFTGSLPPSDFYDPATGTWRDTNGLGQRYVFAAGGTYTYAGFLRLQNGACRTEVSTYKQGTARPAGGALALTPTVAKTRTVVVCGSRSDTTTDGPYTTYQVGWQRADSAGGQPKLLLSEGAQTSEYSRDGLVAELAGGWSLNGVASAGFYNPASGAWATPASDGAWFQFGADGSYRFGEYGFGQDQQGCVVTYWIYQQGSYRVSGGQLAYQAQSGRVRTESDCRPGQASDEPYVDPKLYEFTWELRDRSTAPKLAISPLGQFRYIEFVRE